MFRDDEFPDGLSHSVEHLKLRADLEALRLKAKKFCDNEEAILGCNFDDIIRKTGHGTLFWLYSKY